MKLFTFLVVSFLAAAPSFAGPSMAFHFGTKPQWSPLNLGPALVGWFDAKDRGSMFQDQAGTVPAAIGSPVALWKDKSPLHNHAVQSNASQQPALTSAGLTFLGSSSQTLMVSPLTLNQFTSTNTGSMFAAVNVDPSNGYTGVAVFRNGNGNCTELNFNGNTPLMDWYTDGLYNWNPGVTVPFSQPSVIGFVNNGGTQLISANGATGTNTHSTSVPYTNQTAPLYIGQDSYGPSRSFVGVISEVVMVNTNLSTSDQQKLEGYLAWKWGSQASLPAGHPYQHFAP